MFKRALRVSALQHLFDFLPDPLSGDLGHESLFNFLAFHRVLSVAVNVVAEAARKPNEAKDSQGVVGERLDRFKRGANQARFEVFKAFACQIFD